MKPWEDSEKPPPGLDTRMEFGGITLGYCSVIKNTFDLRSQYRAPKTLHVF